MTINLKLPDATDLKPRITVFGVGGAGGNAVNNMIESHLEGVEFVVANTDAQALSQSAAERRIQMGTALTEGLGAGSQPEVGAAAAEEALPEIIDHLAGAHMVFITAGMGGGTGTGAAPVIARAARDQGILTVGVVTKPFQFEGQRRMATAERGIAQLAQHVDTLIVIPNQNLFRVANEKTTFADAFAMADQVLYSGVAGITDLMVKEGLINLDFADVRAIMSEMGKAMMGTGEASGEKRALEAAEAAIANPLLDDVSMKGAKGLLISITGGNDLTLYEVDEAATRIREEVDKEANIILGATFDETLDGIIRVSVVATGIASDTFVTMPEEDRAGRLAGIGGRRPYVINDRPSFAATSRPAPAMAQDADDVEPESYDEPEQVEESEPEPAPVAAQTIVRPAPVVEPRDSAPVIRRDPPPAQPRREAPVTAHYDAQPQATHQAPPPQPRAEHHVARREEIVGGAGFRRLPPRMPDIDDFPPVAVRELQARTGQGDEIGLHAQKKRVGFLERLANVGIGFKDPVVTPNKHRDASASAQFGADSSAQRQEAPRRADHAAPQAEASTGAAHGEFDDDQLEIPAFLRRQAN